MKKHVWMQLKMVESDGPALLPDSMQVRTVPAVSRNIMGHRWDQYLQKWPYKEGIPLSVGI